MIWIILSLITTLIIILLVFRFTDSETTKNLKFLGCCFVILILLALIVAIAEFTINAGGT